MATVDQPYSTENDENTTTMGSGSTANSSLNAPQVSSGTGTATQGGMATSGGGYEGKGAAAATQSGSYPNLQQYMNANQNWTNSQGQGLGQEMASNLSQQGSQVNNSISSAQNAFNNQGSGWQSNVQNASNAFNQGLANPYGFTQNNPNATAQASTALNASYQGPQSIEASNPNIQQQSQNYVNTAQQTQTEPGRYNLLQQMFGNNNYTQGQQTLDQSLLETNPQQTQALQGAFQQANQTQQNLVNAQNQSQQQAQNWANYGTQEAQQAQNNLTSAVNQTYNQAQQNYQNTLANQQAGLTADQAALASGTISQAAANQLGLSGLGNTYGVNLANYLSSPTLNLQNTQNQGMYNNINALQQLAGTTTASPQAASDLAQFSTAPGAFYNGTNDIAFNNAGANTAINTAQTAYQNAVQQYLQNATGNGITGNAGDTRPVTMAFDPTTGTLNYTTSALGTPYTINQALNNGMVNTTAANQTLGNLLPGEQDTSGMLNAIASIIGNLNGINQQYGGGAGLTIG